MPTLRPWEDADGMGFCGTKESGWEWRGGVTPPGGDFGRKLKKGRNFQAERQGGE